MDQTVETVIKELAEGSLTGRIGEIMGQAAKVLGEKEVNNDPEEWKKVNEALAGIQDWKQEGSELTGVDRGGVRWSGLMMDNELGGDQLSRVAVTSDKGDEIRVVIAAGSDPWVNVSYRYNDENGRKFTTWETREKSLAG